MQLTGANSTASEYTTAVAFGGLPCLKSSTVDGSTVSLAASVLVSGAVWRDTVTAPGPGRSTVRYAQPP